MNLIAVFLTLATTAYSQHNGEFTRRGFVFGAGIGGGVHFVDEATHGRFSIPNLKLGAMVNPRLGIMLYAPGGTYKKEGEARAFEGIIPTVQYWISDRLYVNAGVGLAVETTPFYKVDFSQGLPEFNTGFGCTLSAGYELIQWSGNKTIDVQLRILYGRPEIQDDSYTDNLTFDFLIGFNLY